MKKSGVLGTTSVMLATVALVAVSVHSRPGGTPVPGPVNPITPVPVPIGPGGTYHGPGDTVPFGGGSSPGCANFNCTFPASACGVGTPCPITWTPNPVTGCYNCVCDAYTHPVQSFSVTFEAMQQLCRSGCVDANGDVTIEHSFSNVCDAQVFESSFLIFGGFNNYPTMPPLGSVIVSPCVNGSCAPFGCAMLGPNCQRAVATNCLECQDVTISLTFNRNCMCNALSAWVQLLSSQGIAYATYKNSWVLNISVTTCTVCE